MKQPFTRQFLRRAKAEALAFPWKGALLRMFLDLVLVNASMLLAFATWFLAYALNGWAKYPELLAENFKYFIVVYWFFWSTLALLVFHLNGFYTRARGYTVRYKAWVIFRAVSLFVIGFIFADYLLFRGALVPRGVAVLAWCFTLAFVGGTRLVKDQVLKRYRIQPKRRPAKVERVLVVGGAGYLGSMLVPLLLERGYKVRVLDSCLFGNKALAEFEGHPDFHLQVGDIRKIETVVEVMKDCDAVIHLAAIVGDPACEVNRPLAVEINRAATLMLIDIARGYGVSRFLFASTCSVYGSSDFLVDEHTQVSPVSTYAQSKVDSENLLLRSKTSDFHPTILRLGTLFGLSARPRFDLVVNLLTARAVTTGTITIFNGEQWRPFLHVADAARAFVTCLQAKPVVVSGQIFNVGDYNLNLQLSDLAAKIVDVVPGLEVKLVKNADRRNYRVSFDKIHSRLGFVCEKSIEDGVRELRDAICTNRIRDFTASQFDNTVVTKAFAGSAEAESSSLRQLASLAPAEE